MSASSEPPNPSPSANPNPPGHRWDPDEGLWITEKQWQMKQYDKRAALMQHWAIRRMWAIIAVIAITLLLWGMEPALFNHEGPIYCSVAAVLVFAIVKYGRR